MSEYTDTVFEKRMETGFTPRLLHDFPVFIPSINTSTLDPSLEAITRALAHARS